MQTQRNTYPKRVVLEAVQLLRNHPTVDDVYTEVKRTHPSISKNTVYRNLHLLSEKGDIRQVSLPGEPERYDRLAARHYHLQCENCGGISDIEIDYLDSVDETVRRKYGIEVNGHDIVFRGVCTTCRHAPPTPPREITP